MGNTPLGNMFIAFLLPRAVCIEMAQKKWKEPKKTQVRWISTTVLCSLAAFLSTSEPSNLLQHHLMQKCKTAHGCWSVWQWLRCEHGAPSISWGPCCCVIVHHRLPNRWCTGMKPSGAQTLVCLLLLLFAISAIPHTHRWQHATMLSFSYLVPTSLFWISLWGAEAS